ncbi:ribonucleoside-triphosphate reductase [Moorella sp. E308F]|uniref:anaerobic ribonucleoside-triphosphate reductase n=1 Tax=Moorella sp. E308F TaxID=2572682 RepID=UPI0010FFC723|nr:anaerobic ribonucleoside-triphosphate reductase [Moorella sp. E308F]GEA16809.1 ribonucleoside-triphosphate reductase [Moorella sp. E308F]
MQFNITFEEEFDKLYESFVNDPKGKEYLKLDGIAPEKIDVGAMSKAYFTSRLADASIDTNANANEEISANNYQAEITKGLLKLDGYYLLWKYMKKRFGLERANEAIKAIWEGKLYFHDASGPGIQIPYCVAYSTTPIMLEGRPYGQLHSLPPKRSDSFLAQVTETTMDMSQDFVGAVVPSDFIVNLCYYLKKEGINPDLEADADYIVNLWQKFVHVMNNKFRTAGQSPFTNISIFDRPNLEKIFGETVYPDGSKVDIEYVMKVQKLIAKFFSEGDPATGLPYRFPVMTANISIDEKRKPLDEDFLNFIAETNIKMGVYNIYANEGTKIATCCRLINNTSRMTYRADSFGNGGLNIGSHRVVTINFPRIAQEAKNKDHFFELLEERVKLARDLLIVHREEILKRRIDAGFNKFFKPLNWLSLNMFFSTFGIHGLYEMCYFMGVPMESEEGQQFVEDILLKLEDYANQFSKECGYSFNVEEVPAESAAVTLAKKDKVAGLVEQPFELYSNQYLPLIADVDPIERIKLSGRFMNLVSGGGIVHLNIQERIKSPAIMKKLIKLALQAKVPHFAINYGYGICENGHTSVVGTGKTCPICGGPIKDWMTRIIGYFTRISSWNDVRKNYEYPRRKFK